MIQKLSLPRKTIWAKNELTSISDEIKSLGVKKPLCVLSERNLGTEYIQDFIDSMRNNGLDVNISTNTSPEAPISFVAKIVEDYKISKSDSLIALGGGSTIDLVKAASNVISHGGKVQDYLGLFNIPGQTIPKIFIPTTSGTGSESSNISVLSNKEEKSKLGIVSNYLFGDLIILDPTLTYSMNKDLTLAAGLDAFCQCLESYTSKTSSRLVEPYALEGMNLISSSMVDALDGDEEAQDDMALGAYYSGIAISGGNSGTNLGHAIGNTIGGIFGTPHGISVVSILVESIKFNKQDDKYSEKIEEIEKIIGQNVVDFIKSVDEKYHIKTLSELGVGEDDFDLIAETVLRDQKRLLANNPIEPTKEEIIKILENSL